MKNKKRPQWVVDKDNKEFTTNVMEGVKSSHDGFSSTRLREVKIVKRKKLTIDDYFNGIINGDRTLIARAITLIESNAKKHFEDSQQLIQKLLGLKKDRAIRIGISGVPGAGKSTFIEAIGFFLCELGLKVAVLAVDPSSSITKGSVLGDKTRMEKLSNHPNAFIRPSPSGGMLGGVARKSRETMIICEAADYDVILVETVGVGQNEVTVRSMVDFFLLVLITGAGDDLQGMKKGVMEICDAIVVNKADGDNIIRAKAQKQDFDNILNYLMPATKGWKSKAYTCSALYSKGIKEIWDVIKDFEKLTKESGVFYQRRKEQNLHWVFTMVIEGLKKDFYQNEKVKEKIEFVEEMVSNSELSPTKAASLLLDVYNESKGV